MKTIMLVCAGGMSTSLLVNKMKKTAEERNIDVDIFAVSAPEVDNAIEKKNVDVVLLAPQVKYMKNQFESKLKEKNICMDVINMQYYGMMNGERILEQALELIDM
ncbi:PTS sugar transporter subunit IIB [Clostridium simiarum]